MLRGKHTHKNTRCLRKEAQNHIQSFRQDVWLNCEEDNPVGRRWLRFLGLLHLFGSGLSLRLDWEEVAKEELDGFGRNRQGGFG
ncbi:hypothetical protein AVEN_139356-1 [Araneus ventricosus]|uniref:Uncharacterized protein n=1 Tax=Araneus ventricosus TaxID=182803 RepID=A0A4Y2EEY9_ARAVE|nr:hypothetical protein AVEN_139356-1 [Araneus ventricosus]